MSITQFNNGGTGFGAEALRKARAAGLSDAQIKQQVAAAGLTLGSKTAAALGGGGGGSGGSQPAPIHQFANNGNFGLGALERAQRIGGLSDDQVKAQLANSGINVGAEVQKRFGIGANGLPPGVQESYKDAGSGQYFKTSGVSTPTHGVVYSAGWMTPQQVQDMLAGKPVVDPYGVTQDYRAALSPPGGGGGGGGQQQAASRSPLDDYGQRFNEAMEQFRSQTSQISQELATAQSERDAAKARAEEYEKERAAERSMAADAQLRSLRSGSTISGSAGPGLGSLSSGKSSYSISTGTKSGGILDRAYKDIDPTDSVLDKNVADAAAAQVSSTSSAGRTQARQRALASGSAASDYYSRRFG